MAKHSCAEDVYRELVEVSGEPWLTGLVAFAVVEEQRIDWARHRVETTANAPTDAETRAWYEAQTRKAFERARIDANATLTEYTRSTAADWIEAYGDEIARDVVLSEIRKLGRWLPQLGTNVLGGVIGSMIVATLLVVIGFLVLDEPSMQAFANRLQQQTETSNDPVR